MAEEQVITGDDAQFHKDGNAPEPSASTAQANAVDVTQENVFTFLDNAYYGKGGFRSGTYLIPHKRELWYDTRRKFSYYVNFVKPIVRSMVEPVFVTEASRKFESAELDVFTENIDHRGTHIQDFTYMAVNVCRRHSIVFVVVDNYPEQPADMKTALKARAIPYCYVRKANQLYSCDLDQFGNINMLMFLEKPAVYENNGTNLKEKTQYRKWTRMYTELYVNKNETSSSLGNEKPEYVAVPNTRKDHNLGIVPVAVVRDIELEQPQDFVPDPKLYDLARVNHALFNKDSEIREIERNQAFSVFCVNQDRSTSLSIGTNNVLFYPVGSNAPQYVAPPMEVLSQLIADRKELREDLYRLAEQNGVMAVQEAKSGIALAYEFFAHESVLMQTAVIAETLETHIVHIFNLWMKKPADYEVKYSRDFVPHGEEAKIKMYDTVIMQDPPPLMKGKIFMEEYKALFPESTAEEIEAMENALKNAETVRTAEAQRLEEEAAAALAAEAAAGGA